MLSYIILISLFPKGKDHLKKTPSHWMMLQVSETEKKMLGEEP